jgi:hypothetical protein
MNTLTKVILAIIFTLVLGLLGMGIVNAQDTPRSVKVGSVYWLLDSPYSKANLYEVWDQQGCPANIYIHDTMYQWHDSSYRNTPDPFQPVPQFIHDTLYVPVKVHDTVNTCVTPPPPPSLVSIFTTQTLPTSSQTDGTAITLGVKFRVSTTAYMKAVRFYKVSTNTGQHKGYLYSSTGAILDSGTFINETASGWQTLQLTKNIQLTAGVTYVAAYYSPTGQYSSTNGGFTTAITNGIITGLASGTDGVNGVYNYGNKFPTLTYQNSNYWIDLVVSQAK